MVRTKTPWEDLVNNDSNFADFVRVRPYTYNFLPITQQFLLFLFVQKLLFSYVLQTFVFVYQRQAVRERIIHIFHPQFSSLVFIRNFYAMQLPSFISIKNQNLNLPSVEVCLTYRREFRKSLCLIITAT